MTSFMPAFVTSLPCLSTVDARVLAGASSCVLLAGDGVADCGGGGTRGAGQI